MELYQRFLDFIESEQLAAHGERLLIAVSGGMDSMVMLSLIQRSPFDFGVAHCNFCLRGTDSLRDEELVTRVARDLNKTFYTKSFDTSAFASAHKLSIQMAARKLRYEWLETLRKEHGYHLIATAHHLDDSIETLFIKLTRGTGIEGLQGIPVKNKHIIRPLLFATREEIATYARQHNIQYREDKSNSEDKYTRNRIRHHVIPVLKAINPSLHHTMSSFFLQSRHYHEIFRATLAACQGACVRQVGQETHIITDELKSFPGYQALLHALLADFEFAPAIIRDMANNLHRQAGKQFHAKNYAALANRESIIIYPRSDNQNESWLLEENTRSVQTASGNFFMHITAHPENQTPTWPSDHFTAMVDADKLSFPLILRTWQAGDRMQPLNMRGTKKISDLIIDHKIPLNRKNQVYLLLSNDNVVWACGLALDDKYKISGNTRRIFTITMVAANPNT